MSLGISLQDSLRSPVSRTVIHQIDRKGICIIPFHRIYLTIAVFETGQCLFPPIVDSQQNSYLFHYESSLSTAIKAL